MKKTWNNHGERSIPLAIIVGVALALLVTFVGSLLGASMMNNDTWSENVYTTVSFITWIVSAFLGSIVSGMMQRERSWLAILLTSAFYFLILLSVAILFFDGDISSIGQGVLAILIGSIPAFLICRPKTSRGKIKIPYRR